MRLRNCYLREAGISVPLCKKRSLGQISPVGPKHNQNTSLEPHKIWDEEEVMVQLSHSSFMQA
jgi:hypothetical protein